MNSSGKHSGSAFILFSSLPRVLDVYLNVYNVLFAWHALSAFRWDTQGDVAVCRLVRASLLEPLTRSVGVLVLQYSITLVIHKYAPRLFNHVVCTSVGAKCSVFLPEAFNLFTDGVERKHFHSGYFSCTRNTFTFFLQKSAVRILPSSRCMVCLRPMFFFSFFSWPNS